MRTFIWTDIEKNIVYCLFKSEIAIQLFSFDILASASIVKFYIYHFLNSKNDEILEKLDRYLKKHSLVPF